VVLETYFQFVSRCTMWRKKGINVCLLLAMKWVAFQDNVIIRQYQDYNQPGIIILPYQSKSPLIIVVRLQLLPVEALTAANKWSVWKMRLVYDLRIYELEKFRQVWTLQVFIQTRRSTSPDEESEANELRRVSLSSLPRFYKLEYH